MRDGWYKESSHYSLPIILGWELSGIATAVGEKVSRFKPGDAVFSHPSVYREGGAYAELLWFKKMKQRTNPEP